jgi:hypothetical protein
MSEQDKILTNEKDVVLLIEGCPPFCSAHQLRLALRKPVSPPPAELPRFQRVLWVISEGGARRRVAGL